MNTKINNFFKLLDDLKINFQFHFQKNTENEDDFFKKIENLYQSKKDLFPLDIESEFEELLKGSSDKLKDWVWFKFKDIYQSYDEFILMDYEYLKNPNYNISVKNKNLFYHSKELSANYFFFLTRFYYWYFGRYESREEIIIDADFLNYYKRNIAEFDGLDIEKSIQKLHDYYVFKYEALERKIRYEYTTKSTVLKIIEPEYISRNPINKELKKLNAEYLLKLKVLEDYKNNIAKITSNLKFEFPDIITGITLNTKVRFLNPEEIFNSLKPFLSMPEFEIPLEKLLNGSISKYEAGININLNSKDLSTIFKYLFDINQIVKGTPKSDVRDWIIDNFRYKKSHGYEIVKAEGIKRVFFRQLPIVQKELPKGYKLTLTTNTD